MKTIENPKRLMAGFLFFLLLQASCEKEEPIGLPALETIDVTNISADEVTSGGNIICDGGCKIIAKGILWGCSEAPTLEQNMGLTIDNGNSRCFTGKIKSLQPNVTYHVRAYASNLKGVAYGNEIIFRTSTSKPHVNTRDVICISCHSAVSGGNIVDNGGQIILTRGVVWSTFPNPTLIRNNGCTKEVDEGAVYESKLVGLTCNTGFYIRAYVVSQSDTVYGDEKQFFTYSSKPSVTTASVSMFANGSALSGGNITDGGLSYVTGRGVVWSTTENPTIFENQGITSDGCGIGPFISSLVFLSSDTTWFVRAYATNNEGTAYGQQEHFCTPENILFNGEPGAGVTDVDGNYYPSIVIGNQEWMAENLRVTHNTHGDEIDCFCYNFHSGNCEIYGGLYTWPAMMNGETTSTARNGKIQGICPSGWHVPDNSEWNTLIDHLQTLGYANNTEDPNGLANILKSCRQVSSPMVGDCATFDHPRWSFNSTHYGTDAYGFAALPGGRRNASMSYSFLGYQGYWWSSDEYSSTHAWCAQMSYNRGKMNQSSLNKNFGFSVRCVRD